jgi:hypothetical protein
LIIKVSIKGGIMGEETGYMLKVIPIPKERTISKIRGCARCTGSHDDVKFYRFQRPVPDSDGTVWDWWGICPETKEPILMRMGDK